MPEGFNELETAILNWFQDHYANRELSAQIESARLVKRKWTKVGFYVDFEVSRDALLIDVNDFGGHWPINGPQLQSADIQFGGGSLLWGKDGRADCIEMYAHGDFFNEDVGVFELGPDQ
jgi:hypothetical protein